MQILQDPLVVKAVAYTIDRHENHCKTGQPQRRKYTGEPYYYHTFEVALFVACWRQDPELIAAALLHDTVEDTFTTIEDIRREFGDRVARLVDDLTDVSKPSDGNRKARKAIDRAHTAAAHPDAKTIKLCDLMSNTRSIAQHDPKFGVPYLEEKFLTLEVVKAEADPFVFALAYAVAKQAALDLGMKSAPWL